MDGPSINMYARCRHRTGMTQEQWAEALGLSVDAIRRYEGGTRVPSCWIVKLMIDVSGYDALALQHICAATAPLGVVPEIHPDMSLSEAALALLHHIYDFADSHQDRELIRITEDGVISDEEREAMDKIGDALEKIVGAAYQVRFADKRGGGCT